MFGSFCIGFIDFMLKGKCLLDYTNLFSLNKYEKNNKIILNVFPITKTVKMKKIYCVICGRVENLKNLKCHTS